MNNELLKKLLPMAAVVVGVGWFGSAQALTITLDTEFSNSGFTAENTYTATFESCGLDCVRLTMSITGTNTDEFIDGSTGNFGWGFNLDPLLDPDDLAFAFVSGNEADGISTGINAFKADGDGWFDIVFNWTQAGGVFTVGQTSVYDITLAGLTVGDFEFLSACGRGCGNEAWASAAHVLGVGEDGEGSAWMGGRTGDEEPPEQIPEPGSLVLMGSGLFALWALRRRNLSI